VRQDSDGHQPARYLHGRADASLSSVVRGLPHCYGSHHSGSDLLLSMAWVFAGRSRLAIMRV